MNFNCLIGNLSTDNGLYCSVSLEQAFVKPTVCARCEIVNGRFGLFVQCF